MEDFEPTNGVTNIYLHKSTTPFLPSLYRTSPDYCTSPDYHTMLNNLNILLQEVHLCVSLVSLPGPNPLHIGLA